MVYLHDTVLCKMSNGVVDQDRSLRDWGQNFVCVQKKQDGWASRLWGACHKDCDYESGWSSGGVFDDENLSKFNSVERGVFKRGPSRRAYKIRVLETRYSCKNTENSAEHAKSGECQYKNYTGEQTRSLYGNKSAANTGRSIAEKKHSAKRVCGNNRRIINDTICCRVFQALGDDLIVSWLTPEEVHYTEIAFHYKFEWGRAWHGGKVKDKTVAAHIQYDLQRGWGLEYVMEKYNHDLAFSAFWYLLDIGKIIQLANQYSHYKTIRKLCYFN